MAKPKTIKWCKAYSIKHQKSAAIDELLAQRLPLEKAYSTEHAKLAYAIIDKCQQALENPSNTQAIADIFLKVDFMQLQKLSAHYESLQQSKQTQVQGALSLN